MVNADDVATGIRVRYKWREFTGTGVIKELVHDNMAAVKCDGCSLIVIVSCDDISPLVTENLPPLEDRIKA